MPIGTFQPTVVDKFGGLCTVIDESDLPTGLSPACNDVSFFPGGVKSRDGLVMYLTNDGNVTGGRGINSIQSFTKINGSNRLIWTDDQGSIWREFPEGNQLEIDRLITGAGMVANGVSISDRQMMAISDGSVAIDYPRQYFERNTTPAGSLWGVSRIGGPPPAMTITAVSSGSAGSIIAGWRDFVVLYETATGFVSAPSVRYPLNCTASKKVDITGIPIIPGAVRRFIAVSPQYPTGTPDPRFFIVYGNASGMTIENNTATTTTIDFTETQLLSGDEITRFKTQEYLQPCTGITRYGERLVAWGLHGKQYPITTTSDAVGSCNLDFDGGTYVSGGVTIPGDWVPRVAAPTHSAGCSVVTATGSAGTVLRITGQATINPNGYIENYSYQDYNGVGPAFTPGALYRPRVRIRRSAGAATGNITMYWKNQSATIFAEFDVAVSSLSTTWQVLDGLADVPYPAVTSTSPTQNIVSVFASATLEAGEYVEIDWISIYDIDEKYLSGLLRVSRAGEPESFDSTEGFVAVREQDGQDIKACFDLRGTLYVAKERSFHAVSDNGSEPSNWNVRVISEFVGTQSLDGAAVGDEFAIIAGRNGVYRFDGGQPMLLSYEIQPTWEALDWSQGDKIWVTLDPAKKLVYIGVPEAGNAGKIRSILMLDYSEGWDNPIGAPGSGRKWTSLRLRGSDSTGAYTDGLDARCSVLAERQDETKVLLIGGVDAYASNLIASSKTDADWLLAGGGAGGLAGAATTPPLKYLGSSTAASEKTFGGGNLIYLPTTSNMGIGDRLCASVWCYIAAGGIVNMSVGSLSGTTLTFYSSASTTLPAATWMRLKLATTANTFPGSTKGFMSLLSSNGTDLKLFGWQFQLGPYDHGFCETTSGVAGPVPAGFILRFDSTVTYDVNQVIAPYYRTASIGNEMTRSLYTALLTRTQGSGTFSQTLRAPDGSTQATAARALSTGPHDLEVRTQITQTQLAVTMESSQGALTTTKWSTRRLALFAKASPTMQVRGI